jgi:PKD repeat protein
MDSVSRKITITGPVGDALIDDTAGCQPHQVHFSARNVTTAVKYQWDFGNGAYSPPATTDKATYTYDHAGVFHPKLLLTDAKKCTVIIPINDTLTVVVDSIGLQATHSWPEVCDSGKIQFGARGMVFSEAQLGEPATYLWDFGDPATVQDVSGKPKPVYRYANPGTYYPSLTIHTKFGCAQTILDTVTVPDSVALQVTATADPTAICQGSTIQFQANGTIAESYNWSPATGLSATDQAHVTAAPSASTTYVVTASTKNKCQTDTARVNVVVHSIPKVDAGPDQTVATGSVVQLQATGSTDVVGWKWTPTDYLSCTHCEAPTSTPRHPITYQVT